MEIKNSTETLRTEFSSKINSINSEVYNIIENNRKALFSQIT